MNKKTDKDEALTPGDLAAHVDKVLKALGDSNLIGLVRRLHALQENQGLNSGLLERVPFAISDEGKRDSAGIILEPFVTCVVSHLVLDHESSMAWQLSDFKVGNIACLSPGWSHTPLPLETFSIQYMQDDRFAAVQRFRSARAYPGSKIYLLFEKRKEIKVAAPLRGLLWAEILWS
jgi:hypothetical protein